MLDLRNHIRGGGREFKSPPENFWNYQGLKNGTFFLLQPSELKTSGFLSDSDDRTLHALSRFELCSEIM
jgi:hypothetical protein